MNFAEIADGVHLLTHPVFNVNSVLIIGGERAMLIDTLSTHEQAGELREAARRVTGMPLVLVNTHFHFDHCFGNATLAGDDTPVWGHPDCARELRERGEHWKHRWQEGIAEDDEELALAVGRVRLLPPRDLVAHEATVDLVGRQVVLSHHGRGHTSGDLVARTGDVLIAGDLIEQGAPPGFDDAYPLEWPETVADLMRLATAATTVIPGHGRPVGPDFLTEQHADLTRLDWLIREGHADDAPPERVAAASPFARFGEPGLFQSLLGVRRGYAQLDGA